MPSRDHRCPNPPRSPRWLLIPYCALAFGCSGGGGGSGVGVGTAAAAGSAFNGAFNGNLTMTRAGGLSEHASVLSLSVNSPLQGSLQLSDGTVAILSGDTRRNSATIEGTIEGDCPGSLTGRLELEEGNVVALEVEGEDCDGPFVISGAVGRSADCVNFTGLWEYTELATVVCVFEGIYGTEFEDEFGEVSIAQKGCELILIPDDEEIQPMGFAQGNRIIIEYEFLDPDDPQLEGAIFLNNVARSSGVLIGDEFTLIGLAQAHGVIDREEFACQASTRKDFTRLDGEVNEVTVAVSSFVPAGSYLPPGPFAQTCGAAGTGVFLAGDGRMDADGKAIFDPRSSAFRTRQVVRITRSASPEPGEGPLIVVAEPQVGESLEYAWDALADGTVGPADDDAGLDDCNLLNRRASADTSGMQVDSRVVGTVAVLHFRGAVQDPLLPSPHVDWDFKLVIDFAGPTPTYAFEGQHDAFPAFEVYINEMPVWTHDPGPPACSAAVTDGLGQDLIPPVDTYCDEQLFDGFPVPYFLNIKALPLSGLVAPSVAAARAARGAGLAPDAPGSRPSSDPRER